jgi:hypothetical protein
MTRIDIAREMLNRPGPLTDDERALMKTHPQHSYNLIKGVSEAAAQMALRHHEWDRVDPYPYTGNSCIYSPDHQPFADLEGKIRHPAPPKPLDTRPALPGVEMGSAIIAAVDARDAACSYMDDRPGRSYQKGQELPADHIARMLINNYAGPREFMEFATESIRSDSTRPDVYILR